MTIDHSDFIAKHHNSAGEEMVGNRFPYWTLVALVMVIVILGMLDYAFMKLAMNQSLATGWVVFVIISSVSVALIVQKYLSRFSPREKSYRILNEVIEGSRGARLVTDAANRTQHSNHNFDEFCKSYGPASFESMLKAFSQNPEADAHILALADDARRGLTSSIELPVETKDSVYHYLIIAQPVPGLAGYVHWRIDDVSEDHIKKRALQEEREKLIDFTDNAPVGFFSCDENGHFVFVNATFARWIGTNIESLVGTGRLHSYIASPPVNDHPYDIIEGGGARQVAEIELKGPHGKTYQFSVNQTVVQYDDGAVRTRAVVSDLRAEREMQRALEESRNRFRRFFEEAPLAIAFLSDQHVIADSNEALVSLLDCTVQDLENKDFLNYIDKTDRHIFKNAVDKIASGEDLAEPIEIRLLKHNNDVQVPVRIYAHKLKGSANIVLHFLDLTQQKSLEAQFAQSQKMQAVGQLAGGVAHDFNNLLTAIIGFCDLLLLRHKPGDPSFQDIMQIQQNSNRAANLVRQLLAFSRQQTLRPKVQDITDILTEVSHLIRRLIGANIELKVVHGDDLGFVKVDANQMEQVFVNLAVNARDAMDTGGALTVSTSMETTKEEIQRGDDTMPPGNWVRINVQDTGTGIPDDVLARIFEPFFTTKDVGQGTGLGLATVYGIIRQSGGYLHVDSTVGEGTIFSIYLPEAAEGYEEEDTPKSEKQIKEDLTGTARILLVEDEDAVRTFSTRALTNKGYIVTDANGGEAALEIINSEDVAPDLLITDVIMPDMDGPVMAKKIREKYPELKIIFISGYTEEKLKEHMDERVWFLPKPFTLTQLAAKVKDVLED
ncbi:MAG: hybrid sensor histidine kinase/response regulator [Alphaproteobacteria bacterium]|nr:hybrid sensor histidine kinase/response regulator [Alphaproteobacteria bacterium]